MRLASTLILAFFLSVAGCQRPLPTPKENDDYGPVPDFALTERDGHTVHNADLLGKVWVASFVFTRCTGPCPQVSATMVQLQEQFASEPDVRLVTFTVDPEHDNPKELREYASHFGAKPDRWLFLTGKADEIYRLVNEGFHVAARPNEGEERKPGAEVMHQTRLVVVDRHGRLRGYFEGVRDTRLDDPESDFQANLQRLREKVVVLLREGP